VKVADMAKTTGPTEREREREIDAKFAFV